MLDCQVAILENAIARYVATGEVAGPLGARHPSISPFDGFDGQGRLDGRRRRQRHACSQKLADALGHPALAEDPRFASNALRTANCDRLIAEIEAAR